MQDNFFLFGGEMGCYFMTLSLSAFMGDLSVIIQDLWTQSCPAYGFSLISLFGLSGYNYFCSLYFFWLFPSGSYTKKNLKKKTILYYVCFKFGVFQPLYCFFFLIKLHNYWTTNIYESLSRRWRNGTTTSSISKNILK